MGVGTFILTFAVTHNMAAASELCPCQSMTNEILYSLWFCTSQRMNAAYYFRLYGTRLSTRQKKKKKIGDCLFNQISLTKMCLHCIRVSEERQTDREAEWEGIRGVGDEGRNTEKERGESG